MHRIQTGRRTMSLTFLAVGFLVLVGGIGLLLFALLGGGSSAPAPESKALRLTVPDMKRVEDLPVYDAVPRGYERALRRGSVHVKGTGWPWQERTNVCTSPAQARLSGHEELARLQGHRQTGERRRGDPDRRQRHPLHLRGL